VHTLLGNEISRLDGDPLVFLDGVRKIDNIDSAEGSEKDDPRLRRRTSESWLLMLVQTLGVDKEEPSDSTPATSQSAGKLPGRSKDGEVWDSGLLTPLSELFCIGGAYILYKSDESSLVTSRSFVRWWAHYFSSREALKPFEMSTEYGCWGREHSLTGPRLEKGRLGEGSHGKGELSSFDGSTVSTVTAAAAAAAVRRSWDCLWIWVEHGSGTGYRGTYLRTYSPTICWCAAYCRRDMLPWSDVSEMWEIRPLLRRGCRDLNVHALTRPPRAQRRGRHRLGPTLLCRFCCD
jgi:hypothetical protein